MPHIVGRSAAPKRPNLSRKREANSLSLRHNMTRRPHYRSDKLSAVKIGQASLSLLNQWVGEKGTLGADSAEASGTQLNTFWRGRRAWTSTRRPYFPATADVRRSANSPAPRQSSPAAQTLQVFERF